ncbi:MAG: lipid asymmetry maintenance protein MlaB [Spirochaetaceae bacterium]
MEEDLRVVTLGRQVTITEVESQGAELSQAFSASRKVLVKLSHVERMDLSGVQLLYAARKEARERGTSLHLTGTVPDAVRETLKAGGFVAEAPADAGELESVLLDFE